VKLKLLAKIQTERTVRFGHANTYGGPVVGTTVGSRVGGGGVLFAMKVKSSEHKQFQCSKS